MRAWWSSFSTRRRICLSLLLAAIGCAEIDVALGPDTLAHLDGKVSVYPDEIRHGYAHFRTRCARCHSLATPLSARLHRSGWLHTVRRMARKPGAGIPRDEVPLISAFLDFHFAEEDRRIEEARVDAQMGAHALAQLDHAVMGYPPRAQAGYALFRLRCSRCHSIGRPLTAEIPSGSWQRLVARMARKPQSGIAPREIPAIAAFLDHYTERREQRQAHVRPVAVAPTGLDRKVATYPTPIQVGYSLFRLRCSKCHPLSRPLSKSVPEGSWIDIVQEMAAKKDSGIAGDEIPRIAEFLEHHAAQP